ncbi:hypothetical protein KY342_01210 [Candidatus Woesearchaeota archaeon]|nr:hypothetical protein [Candidatus Woesearchaeota archaeon]
MLKFSYKPDRAFHEIVEASLEDALDDMATDEECGSYDYIAEWFGKERLVKATEKLLEAHKSTKIYMPNDYHFFLLNEFISDFVKVHNVHVEEKGPREIGDFLIGKIDYEAIQGIFFWDVDFEFSPDEYADLSTGIKRQVGFSDEVFGVINKLMPHNEDLELKETDQIPDGKNYYMKGEVYPYS